MVKNPMDEEIYSTISVKVTPRAKKNGIQEVLDDGTVKVRLKAPPVDGKANKSLIKLLADLFAINTSQIEIISGRNRRDKLVRITGIAPEDVQPLINAELG